MLYLKHFHVGGDAEVFVVMIIYMSMSLCNAVSLTGHNFCHQQTFL